MKRMIVSAVLLLIIGSICLVALYVQQAGTTELLELLEQMDTAFSAGDLDACERLSEQFPREVEKKVPVFSLFLQHKDLKDIQELSVMLPVLLRQEDHAHYYSELARCRNILERLRELEYPVLQNIL